MFLSAVMMLEHVGEIEKARRIREAISGVVKEGRVRTYDMMRIPGGANAISLGAASTTQMTDAVLSKLARQVPSATDRELVEAGSHI
jgi:3-isopropylmalate dehydrogenase